LRSFLVVFRKISAKFFGFSVDLEKLKAFSDKIETGYNRRVKYHNSAHGADVARTLNYLLVKSKLVHRYAAIRILVMALISRYL
jgi:hypothetical protein